MNWIVRLTIVACLAMSASTGTNPVWAQRFQLQLPGRSDLREGGFAPGEASRARREAAAERDANRKQDRLDALYDRGIISDNQYDRQSNRIENDFNKAAYGPGKVYSWGEAKADESKIRQMVRTGKISADDADQLLSEIDSRVGQRIFGAEQKIFGQFNAFNVNRLLDGSVEGGPIGWNQVQNLRPYRENFEALIPQSLTPQEIASRKQQLDTALRNNPSGNLDQAKHLADTMKYGERPLQVDVGVKPKANPILPPDATWASGEMVERLARRIQVELGRDLDQIRQALPAEASSQHALQLVQKLKDEGQDAALISNLVGAIGDRDLRRFERNAPLLGISKTATARVSIALALDELTDLLEDGVAGDELRRLATATHKHLQAAELSDAFTRPVTTWLEQLPQIADLRRTVVASANVKPEGNPKWPEGDVDIVLDPGLEVGDSALLSNGWVLCGVGNSANRVGHFRGDLRLALGLPLFESGTTASLEPGTPFLTIAGGTDGSSTIRYRLRPLGGPKGYDTNTAPSWDYSISAGKAQTLKLESDGSLRYEITSFSPQAGVAETKFLLRAEAGRNPRYELRVGADQKVVPYAVAQFCTLDNSQGATPFRYMLGNQQMTIRAGAVEEFDSSVTIRYAPDPEGQLETAFVLRDGETGYIGVTPDGQWRIMTEPKWKQLDRAYVDLNLPRSATEAPPARSMMLSTLVEPKGTLYVIAIGVSKYVNAADFPALQAARGDAEEFVRSMSRQTGLYRDIKTDLLLDENATAFGIRNKLIGLNRQVTKNDVVVIFLSGHGKMDRGLWYFCPNDAAMRKGLLDPRKAIASTELERVTRDLRSKYVCLMLDSCFSGGATKGFQEQIEQQGKTGVVVFASSTETQASEGGEGRGILTKSFLEALADQSADENGDNILEVLELDGAIANKVRDLTQGRQHFQAQYGPTSARFQFVKLESGG